MIPAPVRSVPQTDRWCLRLLTIMQRGCDTSIPLWRRGRSLRGCCEWVGMPIVGRRRSPNSAKPKTQGTGTKRIPASTPVTPAILIVGVAWATTTLGDVADDHPDRKAVEWTVDRGPHARGDPGNFNPDDEVTGARPGSTSGSVHSAVAMPYRDSSIIAVD